jgi:hypothetical protein
VDANSLIASVVISSVGVGLLIYGKKQQRFPQLAVGLVLVAYTYFVSEVWLMFAIAAVLIGLMVFAIKLGW